MVSTMKEWIMPYITSMEVALIWLVIFLIVITTITGTIFRIVLAFVIMPKSLKKLIRNVAVLVSLAIAIYLWWLIIYPLV